MPPPCHLTTASSSFLILELEPLHLCPLALTLNPNLEIKKESRSSTQSLFLIQISGRFTCPRNFDSFSEHYKWTLYGFIPRSFWNFRQKLFNLARYAMGIQICLSLSIFLSLYAMGIEDVKLGDFVVGLWWLRRYVPSVLNLQLLLFLYFFSLFILT